MDAQVLIQALGATAALLGGKELFNWLVNRRKVPAEIEVQAAGAQNVRADTTDKIQGAAGRQMDRLEEEIAELRAEVRDLRSRDRQRDELAARHAPYDRQMAVRLQDLLAALSDLLAGRTVSPSLIRELERPLGDPPPLYLPPVDPLAAS